jgi:hypothetical protein
MDLTATVYDVNVQMDTTGTIPNINETFVVDTDQSLHVDFVPVVLLLITQIQNKPMFQPCTALLDTGSSGTWIHERMLPVGTVATMLPTQTCQTAAGLLSTNRQVLLTELFLPDFSRTRKIEAQYALVLSSECRYDLIMGRDFLANCQIKFDFGSNTLSWFDIERPMKPRDQIWLQPKDLRDSLFNEYMDIDDINDDNNDDFFASEIKPADYKKVDVAEVAQSCSYLLQEQRNDLQVLLEKFPDLFDGTLGCYPHRKLHLNVEANAVPVHARPYPVPRYTWRFSKEN